MNTLQPGRLFLGRIDHGCDLLDELNRICRALNISLGTITGLGAVQQARLGFYDQVLQEYRFITFDQHLEITHLVGNISLKEGIPFVHAHVTLANEAGDAFGGHLATGTQVFAAEVMIQALEGEPFHRELDQKTGLPLWTNAHTWSHLVQ